MSERDQTTVPTIPVADTIILPMRSFVIECPSCDEEQGGWLSDPRAQVHTCDQCGKEFRVSETPEFRFPV
jgi:hypothetical protein